MLIDFIFKNQIAIILACFLILVPIVLHGVSWYFILPVLLCMFFIFQKEFIKFIFRSAINGWFITLLLFYFLISSTWAYSSGQVLSTFINQIFKPLVCFFCIAWIFNRSTVKESSIGDLFFMVGGIVSIITVICLIIGGKATLWKVFYDLGFYSTFVVMIAASCVPFLDDKKRFVFYPLVGFMFYLTDQRVVWVLYPFIMLSDVVISSNKISWKQVFVILFAFSISYFILKYLQEIRPADAFNNVKNQQSMGLLDYMLKNERLSAWRDWASRGMGHPLFGVGFGKENAIQYFSSREVWSIKKLYHAHNIFLNVFVQTGLVGIFLFLQAYGGALFYLFKKRDNMVAVSMFLVIVFYVFRNQFDCFDSKRIMMVYFYLLGVGYGYLSRTQFKVLKKH